MVATDGRRLSYIARPVKEKNVSVSAIIPSKALVEVERLLAAADEAPETVKVSITENQVAFKLGETVIISRLIEGNFPNYEELIRQVCDVKVQVDTRNLLTMTQRAALGSGERGGAVRYALDKGRLRAIGTAQGRVEVEDEMPVDSRLIQVLSWTS
jgi:DNA polymerase-3 subunit beta